MKLQVGNIIVIYHFGLAFKEDTIKKIVDNYAKLYLFTKLNLYVEADGKVRNIKEVSGSEWSYKLKSALSQEELIENDKWLNWSFKKLCKK